MDYSIVTINYQVFAGLTVFPLYEVLSAILVPNLMHITDMLQNITIW